MLITRSRRLAASALLLLLFVAVYAASNLLPAGQAWENRLLRAHDASGMFPGLLGREIPLPPFDADVPTLVVGTLLAAVLAATRRRWRALVVVLVATPAALVATQVFKQLFGRPDLIGAVLDTDTSYPSGHAAIAFAVTAALLVAVPAGWLRWAAPLLIGWSVLVAAALQAVGDHRPSEVLGTGLLVPALFLLVGTVLPERTGASPAPLPRTGGRRVVGLVALVVVAIAGGWNTVPWAIGLYAVVALGCVALVTTAALALRPAERLGVRDAPDQRPRPEPAAERDLLTAG